MGRRRTCSAGGVGRRRARGASGTARRVLVRAGTWVRGRGGAGGDAGMATAEYAIATLAAVAFAGVLLVVLKGNEVKALLTGVVTQALGG